MEETAIQIPTRTPEKDRTKKLKGAFGGQKKERIQVPWEFAEGKQRRYTTGLEMQLRWQDGKRTTPQTRWHGRTTRRGLAQIQTAEDEHGSDLRWVACSWYVKIDSSRHGRRGCSARSSMQARRV